MASSVSSSSSSKPKLGLSVDPSVWIPFAGPLPFNPTVGSFLHYFPQGHLEHVRKLTEVDLTQTPNSKKSILCKISKISYLADTHSEEIFAAITLKPVAKEDATFDGFEFHKEGAGFYSKPIAETHLLEKLQVPLATKGVFPIHGSTRSLTLTDITQKSWTFTHRVSKGQGKSCYYLTDGWIPMCLEKGIRSGDKVMFKKFEHEIWFYFQRKQSPAAERFTFYKENSAKLTSKAIKKACNGKKFRLIYFPNWVEFLVDPSLLSSSNESLRQGIRVQERNSSKKGKLIKCLPNDSEVIGWKTLEVSSQHCTISLDFIK